MADKLSRRDFMKKAGLTIAGGLAGIGGLVGGCGAKQATGGQAGGQTTKAKAAAAL